MTTTQTPVTKLRRARHCAYDIHYHFVFVVKYRRSLLRPEVEAELGRISRAIAERYEIEVESLGADLNHVHLLCSAHPKVSASDIARIYKSLTARELFQALPALRKELWGGQFWSDGYYVATVGQRGGWAALVRYISCATSRTRGTSRRRSACASCSGRATRRRPDEGPGDTSQLAAVVIHSLVRLLLLPRARESLRHSNY